MRVDHGPQDPEEKKDYSLWWFVLSLLLMVSFVWSLVDETWLRRPWKKWQAGFNKLELKKLKDERDGLAKSIQDEQGDHLKEIDKAIADSLRQRKSKEYVELDRRVQKAETKYKEADQDRAFTKADLDEAYYLLDHARMVGESASHIDSMSKRIAAMEKKLAEFGERSSAAEKEFLALSEELKAKDKALDAPKAEKEKLYAQVADLDRKIGGVRERVIEIQQVVSDGLWKFGRIDRCQTCHMGINKTGFEEAPQPYTTHPRREELFKHHPPEKFGCTACHHGQGPALTEFKAHGYEKHKHGDKVEVHTLHHWEEPMYRGDFMEASCNDCHGPRYGLQETKTWAYATRMFTELGCHGCHLLEGFEKMDKVGPELNRIGTKVSPEWLVGWIENPTAYNPNTRMPNFRLSHEESVAVAAFLLSNSEKDYRPHEGFPGMGPAEVGRQLVENVGCKACHIFNDDDRQKVDEYRAEHNKGARDHGPQLSRIAEKTNAAWIYNWLRNPKDYNPHTRMPSLRLSESEARSIMSFLMQQGKALPADSGLRQALASAEVIAKGREIVNKRGCYGCHAIKGFENAERIGPELTPFALKTPNEMFFGDTLNKDAPVKVEDTWEDWTRNKLKAPNVYDTDRVKHLMPTFNWRDPKEIEALLVFLKGQDKVKAKAPWYQEWDARVQAMSRGAYLADMYNCNACHIIEGKGGTVRAHIQVESLAPPNLASVGRKVKPDWLFHFLQNPTPVRPWLKIRMPSFNLSDEDFGTIIRYFQGIDNYDRPFMSETHVSTDPQRLNEGRAIFNTFACTSCHVVGNVTSLSEARAASAAPNLALAHARLNPDWMLDWMAEPGALVPGTRMPPFWDAVTKSSLDQFEALKKDLSNAADDASRETLQTQVSQKQKEIDNARRDIRKVRDYVLSLR